MPIQAKTVTPLLQAYDMRRSVAFYCDKLGFEIDHKWEPDGHLYWAMLKLGGAVIMLNAEYEDDKRPTGPEYGKPREHLVTLYFLCDDVDGKYQELLAKGLAIKPPENAFYGERQLFVRDPDGYDLVFQHPVQFMEQPIPVQPLTYARTDVDAERDLESLDRAMAARLCRIFGICLTGFAVLACIPVLQQFSAMRGRIDWDAFILLGLTFPPGLTLLLCVKPIRRRSSVAVIMALVATLWTGAVFGMAFSWIAYVLVRNPFARGADPLVILIILGALLLACANLLYHTIRLLVLPGRGASQEAVRGVFESLGAAAPDDLSAGLSRLAILRVASSVLAALTAIAILAMNSIILPPPPPPPTLPPPFGPASPAPVLPQQGDVMLESSRFADVAMLATASAAIVMGLQLRQSARNRSPAQAKTLLAAHMTMTPIGAAIMTWVFVSIWLDNPQYRREMRSVGLSIVIAAIAIWMILVGVITPLRALRHQRDSASHDP